MGLWLNRIQEVGGQYKITLPIQLIRDRGWEKGDVLMIRELRTGEVLVELAEREVRFERKLSKRKNGTD